MTKLEWESLCDGCGKCCLLKIEDEDDAHVTYTNIACRLFDDGACTCMNYPLRNTLVKGCIVLSPDNLAETAEWLPTTCAYRLLSEGADLPAWHPLVTGNPNSVHEAGMSMQDRTVPEFEVPEEDWWDHAIEVET
ncbi:UNVERIFIED_CONTAM: hypothetical protein GTU68_032659 [Idotea baltica]|nr:hypothetical protein [Idotea baltica]